jgi:hypothetical protein
MLFIQSPLYQVHYYRNPIQSTIALSQLIRLYFNFRYNLFSLKCRYTILSLDM